MANVSTKIDPSATIEEKNEIREARKKEIMTYILNAKAGVTIKETIADTGIPSDSVRRIMKSLLEEELICAVGKEGKAIVYIDTARADISKSDSNKIVEQRNEDLAKQGGKEFVVVKPAIHVDQGDVIWISSRSGDGMFFRYLIVTPWEKKATVLGIFEAGHPMLNLNDPRFVFIGVDPEKGVDLYVDLSNLCSRAYAQFGERLMTVDSEYMNNVKEQMARYHRIPKIENQEDVRLKKRVGALTEENATLKENLEGCRVQIENQTQTIHATAEALHKEAEEKKALQERNDNQKETIINLQKELESREDDSLDDVEKNAYIDTISSLSDQLNIVNAKLECKEQEIERLTCLFYTALRGGVANE